MYTVYSQKPPETVSEVVNLKNFQGSMALDPPSFGMLPHAIISPLWEEILQKSCSLQGNL